MLKIPFTPFSKFSRFGLKFIGVPNELSLPLLTGVDFDEFNEFVPLQFLLIELFAILFRFGLLKLDTFNQSLQALSISPDFCLVLPLQ